MIETGDTSEHAVKFGNKKWEEHRLHFGHLGTAAWRPWRNHIRNVLQKICENGRLEYMLFFLENLTLPPLELGPSWIQTSAWCLWKHSGANVERDAVTWDRTSSSLEIIYHRDKKSRGGVRGWGSASTVSDTDSCNTQVFWCPISESTLSLKFQWVQTQSLKMIVSIGRCDKTTLHVMVTGPKAIARIHQTSPLLCILDSLTYAWSSTCSDLLSWWVL